MFNDTHLTRLRLITSMLDRGYNIAHVREMLSAWEEGKNLGDVLGLETAIVGTWTTEKSQTMPLAEARRLVDDPAAFDRLVALHVIRVDGEQAIINRPKLIDAINEILRFRTQAVATVTATLASSIESTVESLVGQILADYLGHSQEAPGAANY